jgi:hypothetical protein
MKISKAQGQSFKRFAIYPSLSVFSFSFSGSDHEMIPAGSKRVMRGSAGNKGGGGDTRLRLLGGTDFSIILHR